MKFSSRIMAAASAAAIMLTLSACSNFDNNASNTPQKYHIGICQQEQNHDLDEATEGFQTALIDTLGEGNVTFDLQIANNNPSACTAIVDALVSSNVDLLLANGTTPIEIAAGRTETLPIIATDITDYAISLGIEKTSKHTGKNISGTSALISLDKQAAMIQELFKDAKTVGMLYSSAEPYSVYQVEIIEKYLTKLEYNCVRYPFSGANDVAAVTKTATENADVIFIPVDQSASANIDAIANVVLPAKTPVISVKEDIYNACGIATLSVDYYQLGYQAGIIAYDILANGTDISTKEIESALNAFKLYNENVCTALGFTMPGTYLPAPPERTA